MGGGERFDKVPTRANSSKEGGAKLRARIRCRVERAAGLPKAEGIIAPSPASKDSFWFAAVGRLRGDLHTVLSRTSARVVSLERSLESAGDGQTHTRDPVDEDEQGDPARATEF